MDDRLEKAMEHANYKASLSMTRKNLELRYLNALLYSTNGGIFEVTQELMTFVDMLLRRGHEDAVLIDQKGNPIGIEDLKAFSSAIEDIYFQASNQYHAEFEKIKKARSVKSLIQR